MIGFDFEINIVEFTSKFTPARKILGLTFLWRGTFHEIRRKKSYCMLSTDKCIPDPPNIRWPVSLQPFYFYFLLIQTSHAAASDSN